SSCEIRTSLASYSVVRFADSGGEVRKEVDHDLRLRLLGNTEQPFVVVDITDHAVGTECSKGHQLRSRPGEADDVVTIEVRQRRAAEDTGRAGKQDTHLRSGHDCRLMAVSQIEVPHPLACLRGALRQAGTPAW